MLQGKFGYSAAIGDRQLQIFSEDSYDICSASSLHIVFNGCCHPCFVEKITSSNTFKNQELTLK